MAPKRRPKSAPRITARSVNSLILSSVEMNGRNSLGGAVELHGRSLKESLPGTTKLAACGIMPHERRVGKQILGGRRGFGHRNGEHPLWITRIIGTSPTVKYFRKLC